MCINVRLDWVFVSWYDFPSREYANIYASQSAFLLIVLEHSKAYLYSSLCFARSEFTICFFFCVYFSGRFGMGSVHMSIFIELSMCFTLMDSRLPDKCFCYFEFEYEQRMFAGLFLVCFIAE